MVGHDIDNISLAAALHVIGRQGVKPVPPLNLVGNLGGGGMMLASAFVFEMKEAQQINWAMQSPLMALHSSWQCLSQRRQPHLLLMSVELTYSMGGTLLPFVCASHGKYVSAGSNGLQLYSLLLDKGCIGRRAGWISPSGRNSSRS